MFTENDLRELLEFKTEEQVLSVYLSTDPTLGSADAYRPRLRGMLKDIELEDDVENIERYIDFEYDWSGKAVALFSCAAEDFFRVHTFSVPLRDRVRSGDRPYVKPLADLLDFYGGYGLALVDKIDAKFKIENGVYMIGNIESKSKKIIAAFYNDIKTQHIMNMIWNKRK